MKMKRLEAVILAGGLGTRLRPMISDVPKPMAPVNGRPFLEYLLDFWVAQGVTHFILSVGYKYQVIIDHFGLSYRDIPIDYSIESKPVGTGGGLFLASGKIFSDKPFFVINGDTYFPVETDPILNFHIEKKSGLTLVLREMSSAERYGTVLLSEGGRVKHFSPPGNGETPFLINGGVYLVEPEFLHESLSVWSSNEQISLEDKLFKEWIKEGRSMYGFIIKGNSFIDIGIPEDYKRCYSVVAQSRNSNLLEG